VLTEELSCSATTTSAMENRIGYLERSAHGGRRLTEPEMNALKHHLSYNRYAAAVRPKSIVREDWAAMVQAKGNKVARRCCA
jgi:hypothetical protein